MEQKRLNFIDAMRAFAILMMLQGHFITLSFKDYESFANLKASQGYSGSIMFDWWHFMRGLTAPLFFFVTGLVFVFLLLQTHSPKQKNPRVRKGLIRGCELIFWGYLLQLDLRYIQSTFSGENPFIYAFHVLQCIGVSLLFLIVLYLIYKKIKKIPLTIYYLFTGVVFFGLWSELNYLESFPKNSPQLLQNIFKGPYAIFPMIPWAGFTMFGGLFGVIINTYKKKLASIPLSAGLLITAIILKCLPDVLGFIWLFTRLGEVLLITFIFIQLERWFTKKGELFLSVGKKTLFIYIWHNILLYGMILGFGLNNIIKQKLSALQAIIGAILFLIIFINFSKLSPFFDNLKFRFFKFLRIL